MNPRLFRFALIAALAVAALGIWMNMTSRKVDDEGTSVVETVRVQSITSNLRMIASTGQQHMLTEGTDSVGYTDLVTNGYLSPIQSLHGESYQTLEVHSTGGVLKVTVPNHGDVTYRY